MGFVSEDFNKFMALIQSKKRTFAKKFNTHPTHIMFTPEGYLLLRGMIPFSSDHQVMGLKITISNDVDKDELFYVGLLI
jgi:hypothetical protein